MRGTGARSLQFLLIATACAALVNSCSNLQPGGPRGPKPSHVRHLAVADEFRVLIYNSPFTTDEAASVVLGQPDFDTNDEPISLAANNFGYAFLSMDRAENLFVVDSWNCRVLEFQPPFTNGMNASVVIGQPDFTSGQCSGGAPREPASVSASEIPGPVGAAVDTQGNLWVVDFYISRITEYGQPLENGMAATLAIGQTNLHNAFPCNGGGFQKDGTSLPPTANTLCSPTQIAFDAQGNLWAVDFGNYRVLEYSPPFSTGMAATLEIGYPEARSFDSQYSVGPSATSLCGPAGLAFDGSGNLWVADADCGRVLEFVPPFTDGMAASLVLGQPDFTHGGALPQAPAPDNLSLAGYVTFDRSGELMVGAYPCRVMIFTPPFRNGMSASKVLGQDSFTSGNCQAGGANTFHAVSGVAAF
jgi:hypothetical protein